MVTSSKMIKVFYKKSMNLFLFNISIKTLFHTRPKTIMANPNAILKELKVIAAYLRYEDV